MKHDFYYVKADTKGKTQILKAAKGLGWKCHDEEEYDPRVVAMENSEYETIVFNRDERDIYFCDGNGPKNQSSTFATFKISEIILDDVVEIEINDEYTAEVYSDKVIVGCQVIPFSKVEAIYEKMVDLRNE